MKDTEMIWRDGKHYFFEWKPNKEGKEEIRITETGNSEEIEMLETYDFIEVQE